MKRIQSAGRGPRIPPKSEGVPAGTLSKRASGQRKGAPPARGFALCYAAQKERAGPAEESTIMRILSGVQPSGRLHLGNYFGAIRQFVRLQEEGNECFYFIANYHAMTSTADKSELE